MHFGADFVVALLVLSILEVGALASLAALGWKAAMLERAPNRYPVRRALRRASPVAVVAGIPMCASGWLYLAAQQWSSIPAALPPLIGLLTLIPFGFVLSIWLLNRPSFLVPPEARDDPGLVTRHSAGPHRH